VRTRMPGGVAGDARLQTSRPYADLANVAQLRVNALLAIEARVTALLATERLILLADRAPPQNCPESPGNYVPQLLRPDARQARWLRDNQQRLRV